MVPCNGPKNQNRVHLCILTKGIADAYSDTLHTVQDPLAQRANCSAHSVPGACTRCGRAVAPPEPRAAAVP